MNRAWLRERLLEDLVTHSTIRDGEPAPCRYCRSFYGHIVDQVIQTLESEFLLTDWQSERGA